MSEVTAVVGSTCFLSMARHKANHLNVVYAPDADTAQKALTAKATMLDALGVKVHLCGGATV